MHPARSPEERPVGQQRWWLAVVLAFEALLFLPSLLMQGVIRAPLPKLSEATNLFYPWNLFWRDQVLSGHLPFWNPYMFAGLPVVAEPQAQTFYPGHLLWLVFPPEAAFKLSMLVHILLASWLMYRLVRELGASRFGAAISALAYGLHGQMIGFVYAGWIHQVTPMAWAPGVIWMICRAFRDRRRWPGGALFAAGGMLGIQILSGHPEWVRYTLYIAGLLILGGGALRRSLRARIALCGTAIVIGMLIGGIQLVPTAQAATHSARGQDAAAKGSVRRGAGLPVLTLPTLIAPKLFGPWDYSLSVDGLAHKLSGSLINYSESLIYVGVLPLGLAFIAWRRRRDLGSSVWILIAIAGVLFALNDITHLLSLVDFVVKPDSVFRSPARFVFLTNFSLAVLAGLGATALSRSPRDAAMAARGGLVIAIGLVAGGGAFWLFRAPAVDWALSRVHTPTSIAADPRVAIDGGRTLGLWAISHAAAAAGSAAIILIVAATILLRAARRFDTFACVALMACLCVDLAIFDLPLLTSVVPTADAYAHDAALLQPLIGHPSARVSVREANVFEAGDNVTVALKVRSIFGYDSFSVLEWDRLWNSARYAGNDVLATIGVTHVAVKEGTRTNLIEVTHSRGHAWWTNHVAVAPDADAAVAMLPALAASGGIALERAGHFLANREANPKTSQETNRADNNATESAAGAIAIDEDVPGRFRASVTAPTKGWFVFNEVFYPGWRALVNGQPAPIARVFGAYQAVFVPAGNNHVDFAFRPTIVWWGAATTGLGLLLGLMVVRLGRRLSSR